MGPSTAVTWSEVAPPDLWRVRGNSSVEATVRLPANTPIHGAGSAPEVVSKMGVETATESLRWGVNDLGGTLMEENISRLAGSYHGVRLEAADLVAAAHAAGRPAAERTTLYEIRRRHPVAAAA